MSAEEPTQDELKRAVLFVPCESKKALHRWIHVFLDVDFPDSKVDPQSTCTPMEMLWEVYSKCLKNDDPDFDRVLYYASRDSYKTLGAAILEVLSVVHLDRSVAHMAAIEGQSKKSQQYVKKFLGMPFLREYVVGDNQEITWVVHYKHKELGHHIPEAVFQQLTEDDKNQYVELRHFIRIVICTMAGANSEHVPLFVIDEVDVVANKKAYIEAQMIPAPYAGKNPITLLTSTRKFSFGLVQKEIDNAAKSGLKIRHWNLIDVTEACKPDRHLPDEPKFPIYVSDEALDAIPKEDFDRKSAAEQQQYVEYEGYAGCLKNCSIFAACKGRLATEQKSTSKLLKPLTSTINNFRKMAAEVGTAKAQLLCWKPSTEGLIYPNFATDVHMLTPAQMAEKITGEIFDPHLTKDQLIAVMQTWDLRWYSGMDFGYTHNFAVVTGAVDGMRAFVVDVIAQPQLEASQQLDVCKKVLKPLNPTIFADPENPQMVKTLKKAGFRMREWKKLAGSVIGGIDAVRMKLRPTMGQPQLFFLKGDPGCELLAKRLGAYHWKLDAAGVASDVPDDEEDDECDALRYFIMNVFAPKGSVKVTKDEKTTNGAPVYTKENWFKKVLQEHGADTTSQSPHARGRSGNFKYDMT